MTGRLSLTPRSLWCVGLVLVLLLLAEALGGAWPDEDGERSPWDSDSVRVEMEKEGVKPLSAEELLAHNQAWEPRLRDETFMNGFVNTPGLPPEMAHEPWFGWDPLQQMQAMMDFFDHLVRSDPGFAQAIHSGNAMENRDEWLTLASEAFYGHDDLLKDVRADEPLPEQTAPRFDTVPIDRLRRLDRPSVPPATLQPPAFPTGVRVRVPTAPSREPAQPAAARARARGGVGATARANEAAGPDSADPATDFLDYRVCAESASMALQCSAEIPLGTPLPVDVTGDGVPDVTAGLSPAVDPEFPAGFSALFSVDRLVPAGTLPAHVYALFEAPTLTRRFSAGFDGRAGTLAPRSEAQLTAKDLAGIAVGVYDLRVAVRYPLATPAQATLTLGTWSLSYAPPALPTPSDPVVAAVRFQPVPASFQADVTLDVAGRRAVWSSSGPVGGATIWASIPFAGRRWDLWANLAGMPTSLNASFANDHLVLQSVEPIDAVQMLLTNHDVVLTFPGILHASANYIADAGDLDASMSAAEARAVDLLASNDGFRAELRVESGGSYYLRGLLESTTTKIFGQAIIDPLPSSVVLSQVGTLLSYRASGNTNLYAYLEAGNPAGIAAAADPPLVHGASLRGAEGCVGGVCGLGLRGEAYVTGIGTWLDVDPGTFAAVARQFQPLYPFFVADVDLPGRSLLAVQSGIPAGAVDFEAGPIVSETRPDGSRFTRLPYRASAPLGAFVADVRLGSDAASVEVSNVPASVTLEMTQANAQTTISYRASGAIARVAARVRRVADVSFTGGVELLEIPTSVDLSFGRVQQVVGTETYTGPGLAYVANADTLDIHAWVDASLLDGDIRARASIVAADLGRDTTATLTGNTMRLRSTPVTGVLELHVWAEISLVRTFDGCLPSCNAHLRVEFSGHAGVLPVRLNDLGLRVTGLQDMTVRLGIPLTIQGSYGVFQFGWDGITATIDASATARLVLDLHFIDIRIALGSVSVNTTIPIDVRFHLATNHEGFWFRKRTPVRCSLRRRREVRFYKKSHDHSRAWNGFAVDAAGAEGGAWIIMPNPYGVMPNKLAEFLGAWLSPHGQSLSFRVRCR